MNYTGKKVKGIISTIATTQDTLAEQAVKLAVACGKKKGLLTKKQGMELWEKTAKEVYTEKRLAEHPDWINADGDEKRNKSGKSCIGTALARDKMRFVSAICAVKRGSGKGKEYSVTIKADTIGDFLDNIVEKFAELVKKEKLSADDIMIICKSLEEIEV